MCRRCWLTTSGRSCEGHSWRFTHCLRHVLRNLNGFQWAPFYIHSCFIFFCILWARAALASPSARPTVAAGGMGCAHGHPCKNCSRSSAVAGSDAHELRVCQAANRQLLLRHFEELFQLLLLCQRGQLCGWVREIKEGLRESGGDEQQQLQQQLRRRQHCSPPASGAGLPPTRLRICCTSSGVALKRAASTCLQNQAVGCTPLVRRAARSTRPV